MRTRSRAFWAALILLGLALPSAWPQRTAPIAAAMPAPAAPAQLDCTTTVCSTVYLPIISQPAIAPLLNDPIAGAQVDSIAPRLTWTPAITGTLYYIEVATSPTFSDTIKFDTTKSFKTPTQEVQQTIPSKNLDGSTTYYWRVGVQLPEGINYSSVAQFTTAPYDPARLPAAPALVSPANGARLTTLSPTVTWAPAPGAIAYRARLLDATNTKQVKTSGIIDASKTSTTFNSLVSQVVYYWQVRVYSSYGWGDFGPTPAWRFRTP